MSLSWVVVHIYSQENSVSQTGQTVKLQCMAYNNLASSKCTGRHILVMWMW